MHQRKIVTHILLILSIFNPVFAVPVVREAYDAYEDVVAPVIARNVVAMSKERRAESEGAMPSPSSPPPQDETTPSSHSSPPPDGSTAHPGGSAAVAVSSPPDGSASLPDVPASNLPATLTSTSQPYTQVTHGPVTHGMVAPDRPPPMTNMDKLKVAGVIGAVDVAILAVAGGLIWHYRNKLPGDRREIDPDRYVSDPSHPSCRSLNVSNHKYLTYDIFLSSTAKGSQDERDLLSLI